jgi:AcrR family transcriptional regulator
LSILVKMDNVNMAGKQATSYHHGNVRAAITQAAIDALRTQSLEAVSLRKLAQAIGVSHNAPYMHFHDKEALWLAISDAGFGLLMEKIEAATKPHRDWRRRLDAGCEAYLAFAEENREYMLVMFRAATPSRERRLSPKGTEALGVLIREVAGGVSEGRLKSDDPKRLAVLIWTMLHGLTMARLQIGADRGPLEWLPRENRVQWMLDQVLAAQR